MKTKINSWKCIVAMVMFLTSSAMGYTQKPLVNNQWQQRMSQILPDLKKEWTENLSDRPITRSSNISQDDLLNAEYLPVANFTLDYESYQKLSEESNLDFLIKLDTTRIYYYILNTQTNRIITHSSGRFHNGRWRDSGFGGEVMSSNSDNIIRLKTRNIPVYGLYVSTTEKNEQKRGYLCFLDNGQLMCFRPDIPVPQPLLATLLAFRKNQEEMKQLMRQFGLE